MSILLISDKIKNIVNELSLDKMIVKITNYEKFKKKLGMSNERFEEISRGLYNIKRIQKQKITRY